MVMIWWILVVTWLVAGISFLVYAREKKFVDAPIAYIFGALLVYGGLCIATDLLFSTKVAIAFALAFIITASGIWAWVYSVRKLREKKDPVYWGFSI